MGTEEFKFVFQDLKEYYGGNQSNILLDLATMVKFGCVLERPYHGF